MAKIILDSGAFTAWTKGAHIDIDEYIQFIKEHSDLFDVSINLDVIGDPKGSFENWKYMKKAGVDPLPVYHNGAPTFYLEAYMEAVDYIGFGAIAKLNTEQRILGLEHIWDKYLLDRNGQPKKKMHGLGLTTIDIMNRFPWYSVDSASCIKAAAFGKIFLPIGEKYEKTMIVSVSDQAHHDAKRVQRQGSSSFFTLGPRIRKQSIQMMKSMGFELGDVENRQIRPTRSGKGGPEWSSDFFDLVKKPADVDVEKNVPTLCDDYNERYKFNLKVWDLIGTCQHSNRHAIDIYHVTNNAAHLKVLKSVCEEPKILVSYLAIKDSLMKELRILKAEGKNENQ